MTNLILLDNYYTFLIFFPALSISYYSILIGYFYISSFLTAYKLPFLVSILLLFGVFLYIISYHYAPIQIRFFILFVYIGFLLYLFIYTWKEIPMSLLSFCLFFCNYLIFLSYTSGIYYLLFKGLPSPIYFENLTSYSFYKYVIYLFILLAVFIMFLIVYLIIYFFKFDLEKIDLLPFNIKHEGHKLIENLCPYIYNNLFYQIVLSLYKSSKFRRIIGLSHFCLFYLIRLTNTLLFFNFSFFNGDLRYILYLLPVSFAVWILSFFYYSFRWYFYDNFAYCRKILVVTAKKPIPQTGYFLATPDDFNFRITPFGMERGFTDSASIISVIDSFFQLSHVEYFLKKYQENVLPIVAVNLTLRIICWLYLVNFFFFYYSYLKEATFLSLFSRVSSRAVFRRNYATTIYLVDKQKQSSLEKETDGAYKAGHRAAFDTAITDDNGNVSFEGTLTHGPGSANNPSFKVSETNDLSGAHPKGQSWVPSKFPNFVSSSFVGKKDPGSDAFLKRADVKQNIAKNTYKDWGDKNT